MISITETSNEFMDKTLKNNMKSTKTVFLIILTAFVSSGIKAQMIQVYSPDKKIVVQVDNEEKLSYQVSFDGNRIIEPSLLGFEFIDEPAMDGNFDIVTYDYQNNK